MERGLSYEKLKKNVVSVSILCVLVVSCTDPVSAYVATKQQQNIRKEFDLIDAAMRKSDSATTQFLVNSKQKTDSLYRMLDSLNKK